MRCLASILVGFAVLAVAAAPAEAQLVLRASATVRVGDAEGPQPGVEETNALYGIVHDEFSDPEFGSANAKSTTAGPDLGASGKSSTVTGAGWIAQGSGTWFDQQTVSVPAASVGAGTVAYKFDVEFGWSISGEGFIGFGVGDRGANWSVGNGTSFNTLGLSLGTGGRQTLTALEIPVTQTSIADGHWNGRLAIDMSLAAGCLAQAQSGGASANFSAFMRMIKPKLVRKGVNGAPDVDLLDAIVTSDSGIDYSNLPLQNADFDIDGDVDGDDFLVWQRNYPTVNGALRSEGNANMGDDGDVDASDLATWRGQFGLDFNAAATAAGASVPEPAAGALVAAACALGGGLRRATRRR